VTTTVEPEREAIRRVLPLAPVALVVASVFGRVLGGADAAWSAAIAVVIVLLNFVVAALSVEWAAHISPMVLNTVSWFSPVAFALTLVPATIGLLVVEARALSGRLQTDMWAFEDPRP